MFDIESMDKNAQDIAENIEKYLATGHEIVEDEVVKEEKESDDDENIHICPPMCNMWIPDPILLA